MFNQKKCVEEPTCEVEIRVGLQIVGMAMGCVLAQSESTWTKACGVGLTTASFLSLIKKLSQI
jgi:hypothetical protein